jgi:hypothetical protein
MPIEKPKTMCKSLYIYQIQAGLGQYIVRYMNLLIVYGLRKKCLNMGRSQSFIRKLIKQTEIIIKAYYYLLHKNII